MAFIISLYPTSVEDPTTPPIHHQTTFEVLKTQKSDNTAQHNTAHRVDEIFFFFSQSTVSNSIRQLCGSHEVQSCHPQNHTFHEGSTRSPCAINRIYRASYTPYTWPGRAHITLDNGRNKHVY
eukprot:374367_1